MAIPKEGSKEVEYFVVAKSLNKLIQKTEVTSSALSYKKFGAKIITTYNRYYSDFSYAMSKEIEVWTDHSPRDISLNNCVFSYLVHGYEDRASGRPRYRSLEIQGCWPNSEEFTFQISIPYYVEELVAFIYAIIILAETQNKQKAYDMWDVISKSSFTGDRESQLQKILECQTFKNSIIAKYPFMTKILEEGLQYQLDNVK